MKSWLFLAAAAIPCIAALLFCGVGLHEWWLIATHQIAVIPTPKPGDTSAVQVSASSLLPLIFGSGVLAAMFGYALVRRSRKALVSAYATVGVIAALAYAQRAFASPEGGAVAEAVTWLIVVTLAGLITCMVAGGVYGSYQAKQKGEWILKGFGRGILKGIVAFIVISAVTMVVATVLWGLFMAYVLLVNPPMPSNG